MSIDCKEFCESLTIAYDRYKENKNLDLLHSTVEAAINEFTEDTRLEIERKAKKKQDGMYKAVQLIEEALEEMDYISSDEKPRVAICRLQDARSDLIISM